MPASWYNLLKKSLLLQSQICQRQLIEKIMVIKQSWYLLYYLKISMALLTKLVFQLIKTLLKARK